MSLQTLQGSSNDNVGELEVERERAEGLSIALEAVKRERDAAVLDMKTMQHQLSRLADSDANKPEGSLSSNPKNLELSAKQLSQTKSESGNQQNLESENTGNSASRKPCCTFVACFLCGLYGFWQKAVPSDTVGSCKSHLSDAEQCDLISSLNPDSGHLQFRWGLTTSTCPGG